MANHVHKQINRLGKQIDELFWQQEYEEAIRILRQAFELIKQHAGKNLPKAALSIEQLLGTGGALIATEVLSGDYHSALEDYAQALDIARSLDRKEQELLTNGINFAFYFKAKGHYDEAKQLEQNGSYFEAAQVFEIAVEIEASAPQPRLRALDAALNGAGSNYYEAGHYQKAWEIYEKNWFVVIKRNDKNKIIRVLYSIGETCKNLGNYERAVQAFEDALLLAREFEEDMIPRVLNNIALVYYLWKKPDKAKEDFDEAIAIAVSFAQAGDFRYLENFGQEYTKWGQYEQALRYRQEALEAARKLGKEDLVAFYDYKIGEIYSGWGKYEDAIRYFEATLVVARKLQSKDKVATALEGLGFAYRAINKLDKALDSFNEALIVEKELERKSGVAKALRGVAQIYCLRESYAKALRCCEEALELAQEATDKLGIFESLYFIAKTYFAWGKYHKAHEFHTKALTIAPKLVTSSDMAFLIQDMGTTHFELAEYEDALHNFERALDIFQQIGHEPNIATCLINIAHVYLELHTYDVATKKLEDATIIARKLNSATILSSVLVHLGMVYRQWGSYDKALMYYEEALEIRTQLDGEVRRAEILNNIGVLYDFWGKHDKAIDHYEIALEISIRLNKEDSILTSYSNIGGSYDSLGVHRKALFYYEKALELARKLNLDRHIATALNNLGAVYSSLEQYDMALNYYSDALELRTKLADPSGDLFNNLGIVYAALDKYEMALEYLEKALECDRALGREDYISLRLYNIGTTYYTLKDYTQAAKNLEQAIEIKEKLRRTATGAIRRDYLASQISTYEALISAYFQQGDLSRTFQTIELSRAKFLQEQLTSTESPIALPQVRDIQTQLNADMVILVFANVSSSNQTLILIDKENFYGAEISTDDFVNDCVKKYEKSIAQMHINRGAYAELVRGENEKGNKISIRRSEVFETIIAFYRTLLMDTWLGPTEDAKEIGKMLYDLLISPVTPYLADKRELIIIPDGILSFLPFEALIDERGRYLVEQYSISYCQSVRILELLNSRRYSNNRKPLLAFGGAIYNARKYDVDKVENARQLAHLIKDLNRALAEGAPVGEFYTKLDCETWNELQYSLDEVDEITKVVKNAEKAIGLEVSEKSIKALSDSGELSKYKVIHFATHGIVLPFIPELSALVLSQFDGQEGEDGYLLMHEIAQLNLQADFVNLSACETGLGKIYAGEGVVGLAQSFLIAGANGLSISLWEVDDKSTPTFMAALYELVATENMAYPRAITEIKRRFINGDFGIQYKTPYYWAPFVYYGAQIRLTEEVI